MENEAFELISTYYKYWRPICLQAFKDRQPGKKEEDPREYLFLSHRGCKVNNLLGKFSEEAWNFYRRKFCLQPKTFSFTKIRKAAQSKFEDEIRKGESAAFRSVFNTGIGHK